MGQAVALKKQPRHLAESPGDGLPVNQILHGDALAVLKALPDNSVDLVVTSPPYFQQRDYNNGQNEIGNEKTKQEYLDNLFAIFHECVKVTKETGVIVFNLGDKYINGGLLLLPFEFAIKVLEKEKIFLINNITWKKLNPTPRQDKRKLIQSTEPFFLFAKSKNYQFNLDAFLQHLDAFNKKQVKVANGVGKKYYGLIEESALSPAEKSDAKKALGAAIAAVLDGQISSFRMKIRGLHKLAYGGQAGGRNDQIENRGFSIIKITGNKLKQDVIESPVENTKDIDHTAVYPLYIIQELIKLLTDEGDVVLDPFNGSGTSCVAAKNLNRKYIGIEINPDYVKLSEGRLSKADKAQELFL